MMSKQTGAPAAIGKVSIEFSAPIDFRYILKGDLAWAQSHDGGHSMPPKKQLWRGLNPIA